MRHGDVSLDQAAEIAKAEESCPGAASELVKTAQERPFHVLKDEARRVKLEAEQHRGLAERQHAARSARWHNDELGMTNIHLRLEPHVGTPIVARARRRPSASPRKPTPKATTRPSTRISPTRTPRCCLARTSRRAPRGPSWS